jgi:hypothetical protein
VQHPSKNGINIAAEARLMIDLLSLLLLNDREVFSLGFKVFNNEGVTHT